MIYWVIRHKATGELMPQAKRDRGYSNWNPSNPDREFKASIGVPRLIDTRRRAVRIVASWVSFPNGHTYSHRDWESGYTEYDVDFKDDGRKKDDLEIVQVDLVLMENEI
jgi:hypothetical protein